MQVNDLMDRSRKNEHRWLINQSFGESRQANDPKLFTPYMRSVEQIGKKQQELWGRYQPYPQDITFNEYNKVYPDHPRGMYFLLDTVVNASKYNKVPYRNLPYDMDVQGRIIYRYIPEAGLAYGERWRFL